MSYLIFIEIENLGFVYNSNIDRENIMNYVQNVFFEYQNYDIDSMHNIENLELIRSYSIHGNKLYFDKSNCFVSNGFVSAYMILLKSNFCLNSFVNERENYSIPFNDEIYDEKLEKLSEKHLRFKISAN